MPRHVRFYIEKQMGYNFENENNALAKIDREQSINKATVSKWEQCVVKIKIIMYKITTRLFEKVDTIERKRRKLTFDNECLSILLLFYRFFLICVLKKITIKIELVLMLSESNYPRNFSHNWTVYVCDNISLESDLWDLN